MRQQSMPSFIQMAAIAVSSFPSTKICTFWRHTTTSSTITSPQLRCSSQERPWLLRSVPTISTMMPDGWCDSSEIAMSGGGGFFWASLAVFLHSLLGHTTAPAPVTGDAGRLSWTTAPHIAYAAAAHSFLAKVQVLHRQRLWEEKAMVRVVCAVFQHLVFFRTHSHRWAKTCLTNGILGIARKRLTRQTH